MLSCVGATEEEGGGFWGSRQLGRLPQAPHFHTFHFVKIQKWQFLKTHIHNIIALFLDLKQDLINF